MYYVKLYEGCKYNAYGNVGTPLKGENINKVLESAMGYPPTDSAGNRGFDSHTLHNLYNVLK
jgi:hypothetical protein